MFKSTLIAASLALSLSACGGGGGSSSAPVDNSQPIKDAIPGIVNNLPPAPKPFTGAFMSIEGVSVGFVAGSSPADAVMRLARIIEADTTKYEPLYKMMLSDAGLRVVVHGEKIGVGAASGLPIYAADKVFVVRLTSGGGIVIGDV